MKKPVQSPKAAKHADRKHSPHKLAAISIMIAIMATACIEEREPRKSSNNLDGDMSMMLDMMADQPPQADQGACGVCEGGQVCDEQSKQCVQCVNQAQCAGAPCVGNRCVECTESDTAQCPAGKPLCDNSKCVECKSNSDCQDPSKSSCESGSCVSCGNNEGCAHINGAKVCANPGQNTGRCVQCSPMTEAADCAGKSCDPTTNSCTSTDLGSVDRCRPCVSDSDCVTTLRCVPTKYKGQDVGAFCLPIKTTPDGDACPDSLNPLSSSLSQRTSLSGVLGDYCGPNEALATCHAVAKRRTDCQDDADCTSGGLDDGVCLGPVGFKTCTYLCSGDDQCQTPQTCRAGLIDGKRVCRER